HVDYAYYMKGLIHYSDAEGFFGKYWGQGRKERDTSSLRKAYSAFNTLITTFPQSTYTPDAKLRLVFLRNLLAENELVAAEYYLRRGAYLAALNRASFVVANFDQSPSIPDALAIMVKAYRKMELPDLAQDTYSVLALNFPQSPYLDKLRS